jgi:hypothetical protein
MRTHVEFRTSKFPPYDGEDDEINPGLFGKRLAEYLQEELPKHGIATGQIWSEDWGWCVDLPDEPFSMWLGCGNYAEYDDGFLCFIEPSKPFVRHWFKKVDTRPAVERVAAVVDAVLTGDPELRDVRWWSEKESGA